MEYTKEYHDGRHACRQKYVDSGLLVINPDVDIDVLCESPCSTCEHLNKNTKMPCTMTTSCKKKQDQLTAIEIKQYFKYPFKTVDETINENCLYCEKYVFQNGNYYCLNGLQILSYAAEKGYAFNPEKITSPKKYKCSGFDRCSNEADIDYNINEWNKLNPYCLV